MLKEYKVDYHLKVYNGTRYIEKDDSAGVWAADVEDAKESFKNYIKDNTYYKLSDVKITNITEVQKEEEQEEIAETTYEVNFYPTEKGDGIYKMCRTKEQAIKECKRLHKKYPVRDGDAFIRVWYGVETSEEEWLYDIEPEEWQNV